MVNLNFIYKIFLTLLLLLLFRIGVHIPSPGVDVHNFLSKLNSLADNSFFATISTISSGVFGSFSLLSLGVMPYILSSIMTQILSYVYQDDKSQDKKDSNFFTKMSRIFTIVFAIIQSIILIWSIKNKCDFFYCNVGINIFLIYFLSLASTICGSMIAVWIGETITEYSIGNGISMIIFTNIGFDFISGISKVIFDNNNGNRIFSIALAMLLIFSAICIIVLCEQSSRFVRVQYSSRVKQINNSNDSLKSSFIPMKLNFSGVMPLIFTATIIGFLMSIMNSSIGIFNGAFDNFIIFFIKNKIIYYCVYFVLILGFGFLYNGISFNVERVSDSLRKNSGVIPGVKPGQMTSKYFTELLMYLTVIGSFYLFFVSVFVDSFKLFLNINSFVGGTSYLIIVVIALDLITKYKAELLASKYNSYIL